MARPEDTAAMDTHEGESDRSPDLNDKLDQNQKLKDLDLEGQDRRHSHHHVTAIDSSSTSESVGRQIEMEAENTIKYRTCSWQKVRLLSLRYGIEVVLAEGKRKTRC